MSKKTKQGESTSNVFDWDDAWSEVLHNAALELAAAGLDYQSMGSALARIYLALPEDEQAI